MPVAVSLILIIVFLSYYVKKDSSSGRVLIYKISWSMLADHWPKGSGYGTFPHEYLNYQASYFQKGEYTIKELLLADNTKHAFNDYLQWTVETGLPGLVILVSLLGIIIYIIKRAIAANHHHPALLLIAVSLLLAIGTAACLTHVFDGMYFQLTFTAAIFTILSFAFGYFRKTWVVGCLMISLFFIFTYRNGYLIRYRSYQKFEIAKALYSSGYIREALLSCQKLYPHLSKDVPFLNTYAEILATTGSKNTLSALKELVLRDNSYFFHIRLADYYLEIKDFRNAEGEYIKAINMVPNRFGSRYKLFQFYCLTAHKKNAKVTAYQLLHLPVKIPSVEIDNIKIAVQNELSFRNWLNNN